MAEGKTFARKASGLVRGLSLTDTIGVGFMNQGLTPSIWVMMITLVPSSLVRARRWWI